MTRQLLLAMLICTTGPLASAFGVQPPDEVEQRGLQQLIRETEESLAKESWLEAVEKLDQAWTMACEKEDPLMVQTGADIRQLAPGETELQAGGKAKLEALFRNAPEEFREEFSKQYSDLADKLITDAIQVGDNEQLRWLTMRYAFCSAARKGQLVLARRALDRGEYLETALLLGRLLRQNEKPDNTVRLQMALCYSMAGLEADATDLINLIVREQTDANLEVAGQSIPLPKSPAETPAWLQQHAESLIKQTTGWSQPGGSYRRTASQPRGPAKFGFSWKSNLFEVQDVLYAEQYNPLLTEYLEPIEREAQRLLQRNSTIVPTAQPLVTGRLAILRSPFGIRAVDLVSGELQWEVTRPDSRLRAAIDERTNQNGDRNMAARDGYASLQYVDPRARLLYQMIRTNTASQMSISGSTLFVVDECSAATWTDDFGYGIGGLSGETIPANFVRAYDVETGLFKWEVGGQTQNGGQAAGRGNLLAGFYFLGAPLVLGQRTYVLAESGEGLFLIQIAEPRTAATMTESTDDLATASSPNPSIVRSQILTVPEHKLPRHPVRKHAGLVPSFAQGILVCPTCDQRIVAVSAEDQSLRWVFRYAGNVRTQELGGDNLVLFGGRDAIDTASVDMDSRWVDSLPRIVDSRVFVTPRDSDLLYCLDLQSGKELWKAARGPFHAIGAITGDRIVLVGNQRVAAFRTTDGSPIWSTEIRDGVVCGSAASNGQVIQIPTDEPAIVTLDLATGVRLVRQSHDLNRMPGNLLMTEQGLLTQNLGEVAYLAANTSEQDSSLAQKATELLLDQKQTDAMQLLDQGLIAGQGDKAARELLIELLLEELRADYSSNRSKVPRIRELIEQTSADLAAAPLLHSVIGMNITDAAVIPSHLRGRTDRYLGDLSEQITRGMEASHDLPVTELTENIRQLLREISTARREAVGSGFLIRNKATILCAGVRRAVGSRTMEEQKQIQESLRDSSVEVLKSLPEDLLKFEFMCCLMSCGLPQLTLATLENPQMQTMDHQRWLLQEFARLQISQSSSSTAPAAATDLLRQWKAANDDSAIRSWLKDLTQPIDPNNLLHFQMADQTARDQHIAAWQKSDDAATKKTQVNWGESAKVEESPDRTMMEPTKFPEGVPEKLIPFFGPQGVYRDWSFVRMRTAGEIYAYDAQGQIRWKTKTFGIPVENSYGYGTQSYVVSYGHLLLLNISGTLIAIDPAHLNAAGEPRELWRRNIERLAADTDIDNFRDYVPPSERVPQYYPQPAGFYPVGPATPLGIPVIAGRRLIVLDPLTGTRSWQTDGIARDAVLLCSGDNVLVLSEGSRQIEVRSLVDGSVRSVARLPEWWGEANLNVGSSVRDIEVEAGVELLWRIVLQGQSCVLFRLTAGKATVESRDLLTDTVTWSIDLPQETVFSNVANDVIAVLSEGRSLKLIQTDTGRILAEHDVTAVKLPRELILQHSSGHYVILPDSIDDEVAEYDPVIDALHVYGRMYGIRESDMTLAWDEPLDHRHVRLAVSERSVLLPNSPALLLLSRGGATNPRTPIRATHYGARIIDVRTGKDLYNDDNIGTTLNMLWKHINVADQQIQFSFDSRVVTLNFRKPEEK
ncbi:MAG: PQQ-binding-like beta-propeller repeat protein [Planctomycetaceae bacterium]